MLEIVTAACLSVALLLFLVAPIIERFGGAAAADAALVTGLALAIPAVAAWLAAAGEVTAPGPLGQATSTAAGLLVIWASGACALFAIARRRARSEAGLEGEAMAGRHCRSRLIRGGTRESGPLRKETWRTYLFARYGTVPSNGELSERARAWGGTLYILYFKTGFAEITPSVEIVCLPAANGDCGATAEKQGVHAATDQPVRIVVENQIDRAGNQVHVAVSMSAALNASKGPGITVGPQAAGLNLSFPDASQELPLSMGLYIWACEKDG